MKKITLTLIGLVAVSASALAQQEVKFGPKVGVNFANLAGNSKADMITAFHIGAVAEIKFNEKFSVQPEIIYSLQGAESSSVLIPNGTLQHKINNDYINIPIMAKYFIIDGFSVELGPQIGFLVKSEEKIEGNSYSKTIDGKDFYRTVDLSLGMGLAYDLPMGLFVGARYNLGLTKANADILFADGNVSIKSDDIKNNVIQVSVGYKF